MPIMVLPSTEVAPQQWYERRQKEPAHRRGELTGKN